jgi:dephospho-CoA kinase
MRSLIAIVGMTGSGKSECAAHFVAAGFQRVRFGDATDVECRKRGLELTEANERLVREQFRDELGPAAYAILNLPRLQADCVDCDVVIDGLYSWEEYTYLKDRFGEALVIVAVAGAPATRYRRLAGREIRPLTAAEAFSRDRAEIENLNKGGPIAMADYVIVNEGVFADLLQQTERIIEALRGRTS